jgi:peptidoglycan/LPS O-acetylase OafA/YrhL
MIQRIQSIFLLFASACSFALFGFPFASVDKTVENSALFSNDTVYNLSDNIALLIVYVIAGLLAFGAIFLFKNRSQQKSLARVAAVFNLIGIALAVFFFTQDNVMSSGVTPNDGIGLYTPIVGFVLILLAVRAIGKDDKLVKSMDRLR